MARAKAAGATRNRSGRPDPAAVRTVETMWAWLALVVGIAAGAGWVPVAQQLGEHIPTTNPGTAVALFNLLVFGPLFALAIVLGLLTRQPVMRAGNRPVQWTLAGLACGTVAILSTIGFSWLSGGLRPALNPLPVVPEWIALGIGLTVLQAGAEEVLFRGWLQPALIARIGRSWGVLAGALVFAGFHALAATSDPISLANLVLGGLWFGLLALRSRGILAPLAAHFAYNVIEDCGFGLVPNPGVGPLGAWHDLDLIGAPLWGSSAEGLNASLGTTAALVALILPLLPRTSRSARQLGVARGPLPDHRMI